MRIINDDKLGKFQTSFDEFPVDDDFIRELYHYVVIGLEPGSFHRALFENDLLNACLKSHPMNEWQSIQESVKWLYFEAPFQCWGSAEKVNAWLKLDAETRTKICEDKGLVATAWDILKEPA